MMILHERAQDVKRQAHLNRPDRFPSGTAGGLTQDRKGEVDERMPVSTTARSLPPEWDR